MCPTNSMSYKYRQKGHFESTDTVHRLTESFVSQKQECIFTEGRNRGQKNVKQWDSCCYHHLKAKHFSGWSRTLAQVWWLNNWKGMFWPTFLRERLTQHPSALVPLTLALFTGVRLRRLEFWSEVFCCYPQIISLFQQVHVINITDVAFVTVNSFMF